MSSLEKNVTMFQLISATLSPYARKVRIALAEKGLPFKLVTEVPWRSMVTPKYNPLELRILEDGSASTSRTTSYSISNSNTPRHRCYRIADAIAKNLQSACREDAVGIGR